MIMKHRTWLVLADRACGRLLSCGRTDHQSPHVEQIDQIQHTNPQYEHARPSPRNGRTGDTQDDHEKEEEARRFARRLARWMKEQIDRHAIGQLVVFAPPRMLGALRQVAQGSGLDHKVHIDQADLTSLTIDELTHHPRIGALVDGR